MNLRNFGIGIVAVLMAVGFIPLYEYLYESGGQGYESFPGTRSWVVVTTAFVGIVPGLFIGWFAAQRPLVVAAVAGAVSGVLDLAMNYHRLAAIYPEMGVGPAHGAPQVDDYMAAAIVTSLFLCAYAALAVVLRRSVAR